MRQSTVFFIFMFILIFLLGVGNRWAHQYDQTGSDDPFGAILEQAAIALAITVPLWGLYAIVRPPKKRTGPDVDEQETPAEPEIETTADGPTAPAPTPPPPIPEPGAEPVPKTSNIKTGFRRLSWFIGIVSGLIIYIIAFAEWAFDGIVSFIMAFIAFAVTASLTRILGWIIAGFMGDQ